MHFRVTVKGIEQVVTLLERISSVFTSRALLGEMGAFLRQRILLRTARGVDVDEQPFVAYTPRYKFFRQQHGRPVDKVNLFFSGTMLASIDHDIAESSVRLYFTPTTAPPIKPPRGSHAKSKTSPSSPLKAYYLQHHRTRPREFFGASSADVELLTQMVLDRVTEQGT
jgi:hypothetical protein